MIETLLRLDTNLFLFLNRALANPVFDWLMPILSNRLWLIPLSCLCLVLLIRGHKRERLAVILTILVIAIADPLGARVIRPLVKRPRPSRTVENARVLGKKGGKYGFPSNHAANVTGVMVILSFFYRRWKYWFCLLAVLVGFSRIYLGVHYPGDVVAGMGMGVALSCILLIGWLSLANHYAKRGNKIFCLNH